MPKKGKIFYGWWIVLATSVLNFFSGGTFYYGFTVFFNPIREAFGWTAAITSIAFTLQRLESGILGPVSGFLVDRVGSRKLMLFGWAVTGLGFVLMSRIGSLWMFYISFLVMAIGFSFSSSIVTNAAVANWFIRKRSRALTLMYVGYGACGILAPLLSLSIVQFGWRTSLFIVGIALWVIALPLCSVVRHRPEQYGYLPDGETRKEIGESTGVPGRHSSDEAVEQVPVSSTLGFTARAAFRTRTFWLFTFVLFFQHIGTSAVMVHIVPYLESVGVPTSTAATVVAGMTLCSLIGRLIFGLLGDFADKRYLITIAIILQTIGLFIFSLINVDKIWLIIPFLFTYAPGYGGVIPLRPALQADYFGTRSFGTIMGLMAIIQLPTGLASPVIAGWIFDVMGSYRLAWQIFALATVPAIPLMLLAKPPRDSTEP